MTAKEVIDEIRQEIGDENNPDDWTDNDAMFPAMNDEVRAIRSDRTDAQIASDGTVRTLTEITSLTQTVSLDDSFKDTLKDGIKRRLYAFRSEGRENRQRSAYHEDQRTKAALR